MSIFVAVVLAFALNNWNDNRRDRRAELKILTEIANGLEEDMRDMNINKMGIIRGCGLARLGAVLFWGKTHVPTASGTTTSR